jgi:hypothetical protein
MESASKFSKLLRQFCLDAQCDPFFATCSEDYSIAEKQFEPLFNQLDISWYYQYYGKSPEEQFNIIIGLGNGGNNFGPHIDLPDGKKPYMP